MVQAIGTMKPIRFGQIYRAVLRRDATTARSPLPPYLKEPYVVEKKASELLADAFQKQGIPAKAVHMSGMEETNEAYFTELFTGSDWNHMPARSSSQFFVLTGPELVRDQTARADLILKAQLLAEDNTTDTLGKCHEYSTSLALNRLMGAIRRWRSGLLADLKTRAIPVYVTPDPKDGFTYHPADYSELQKLANATPLV
jgi:hypothetical protein